jgi:hypothetical protein
VLKAQTDVDSLACIRKYLQLASPQEIYREFKSKTEKLVSGTATWILKQQAFESWNRFEKPVLTIRGAPGCGKSYLSTMIVNHALQSHQKQMAVVHYYFHDNDESKQSVLNALCSMVFQIAEQDGVFAESAARTCQQSPSFSVATIASIWDDFFASKFSSDRTKAYLVFHEIDEAVQEEIAELISLLQESLNANAKIQVLLIGRPEMETVTSPLDEFSTGNIEISSTLTSQDILRFINYSYNVYLSKHKIRSLRETITSSLRKKVNRMFLWVDLVYQELAKIKSVAALKRHLDEMPAGLGALYEKIFDRILATGSGSKQPAQLRELFCSLVHYKEPPSVLILNQLIQYASEDALFDIKIAIVDSCASLVNYEETGQVLFQTKIKSELS